MTSLASPLAAAALLFAAALAAPQQAEPDTPEQIVRRIVELHQEIEDLLARLSPELRAEVRRRLAAEGETTESGERRSAGESSSNPAPDAGTVDRVASTASPAESPETAPGTSDRESPPPVPTSSDSPPRPQAGHRPSTAAAPSRQSPFGAAVPVVTAPEAPAAEPPAPPPTPRCNTLLAFDDDGDGKVTAGDRLWRHLYLWIDGDDDGLLSEREVRHLYDHGVRVLDVDLRHYTDKHDLSGDVRIGPQVIRFELASSHRRSGEATLVADATGLARSGELELLSPDGTPLEGYQPFVPGLKLRTPTGTVAIDCP